MFKIETLSDSGEWVDDPDCLGFGIVENDNRWGSEADALEACEELADVGLDRSRMCVVSV